MRAAMWWIDRWRQSDAFARMTAEEQGLYRNLCDEIVLRENGVIPDEPRILAKASGDHEAWARSGASVLKSMKKVRGGWTNVTALEVKAESARRSKKQRDYRNRAGNESGNGGGNEPDNEPRPQEKEKDKNPSQAQVRINGTTTAGAVKALASVEDRTALRMAIEELSTLSGVDFDRVCEGVTSGAARTGKRQCVPCLDLDGISAKQAKRSLLDANSLLARERSR